MFAISLIQSEHAHGVGGESAKGPLTVAGKAQFQAQLTQYNEYVEAYHAKLDEIKALETEFNALGEVLEKEPATVDRRDNTACRLSTQRSRRATNWWRDSSGN